MGFRRDQGKAFIAQAGAKGGAALGQKLGKCSMRELAGKGYSIGGVLFGPGFQRAGTLESGFLEMSNVDLADQFSQMIIASRAYQANSRSITTSDEMLQELLNLKR